MLSSRAALTSTVRGRLDALSSRTEPDEPPSRAELRELQTDLALGETEQERIARKLIRSAVPIETRRRNDEKKKLKDILTLLEEAAPLPDAKFAALADDLRTNVFLLPGEKAIVFTEYGDTLHALRTHLEALPDFAGSLVTLTGGLSTRQRLAALARFSEPDCRFLLATDAASEGLNLQHQCCRLYHLELPWNPIRLEQRNGRIDHHGQTRPPKVAYLFYPQSPEDRMLDRLVRRIVQMQDDKVSTPDILGILSGGRIDRALAEVDGEESVAESDKRAESLFKVFDDDRDTFVREMAPLLTVTDPHRSAGMIADPCSADSIVADDTDFAALVTSTLGTALRPLESAGLFSLQTPAHLLGGGVQPRYKALTFLRELAICHPSADVEFIHRFHPLALAVFEDSWKRIALSGLAGRTGDRLAVRRHPAARETGPYALFQFLASRRPPDGTLFSIAVKPDGALLDDSYFALPATDRQHPPGEVEWEEIEAHFASTFASLSATALSESEKQLTAHLAAAQSRREESAAVLREDAARYRADRLTEIEREQKEAEQAEEKLAPGAVQTLLFETREVTGFRARRAAVETPPPAPAGPRQFRVRRIRTAPAPPAGHPLRLSSRLMASASLHNRHGFFSDYWLGSMLSRRESAAPKLTAAKFLRLHERVATLYDRVNGPQSADLTTFRERFARLLLSEIWDFSLSEDIGQPRLRMLHPSDGTEPPSNAPVLGLLLCPEADELDRRESRQTLENFLEDQRLPCGIILTPQTLRLIRRRGEGTRGAAFDVALHGVVEQGDRDSLETARRLLHSGNFVPRPGAPSIIAEMEAESLRHRAKVSSALKSAVFQSAEIVIRGFRDDLAARSDVLPPAPPLTVVRDIALLVLYRLLFILYAESRDPRLQSHALYCRVYSLESMVDRLLKTAPGTLARNRCELWSLLQATFRIFNDGFPPMPDLENIPPRGGPLFSVSTKEGAWIERLRLCDADVAALLLALATARPRRGVGRERISYRELAIEQLGSVYEGLLEYEPRVAESTLFALRVGGRELVLDPAELLRLCREKNLVLSGPAELMDDPALAVLAPAVVDSEDAIPVNPRTNPNPKTTPIPMTIPATRRRKKGSPIVPRPRSPAGWILAISSLLPAVRESHPAPTTPMTRSWIISAARRSADWLRTAHRSKSSRFASSISPAVPRTFSSALPVTLATDSGKLIIASTATTRRRISCPTASSRAGGRNDSPSAKRGANAASSSSASTAWTSIPPPSSSLRSLCGSSPSRATGRSRSSPTTSAAGMPC